MSDATTDLLFASYGPVHAGILVLTVLGSVIVALVGRGHRGTPPAQTFSRAFGVVLLVVTLVFTGLWLLPPYFTVEQSVPLHFSDVLRFLSAWALISHRRLPLAVTYFWGLTFNIQSLLTPDLTPTVLPWAELASYWVQHALVMWAVVYLAWGLRLVPDWRGYRRALAFTVGFSALVFSVNLALGTNYGYLNGPPQSASALDLLGGWPLYLPVLLVVLAVGWAALTAPWQRESRAAPDGGHEAVRT